MSEYLEAMADAGFRRCSVCKLLRENGEPQPYGEIVCDGCMSEIIECPRCEEWYRRAEFVAPGGVEQVCSGCDWRERHDPE